MSNQNPEALGQLLAQLLGGQQGGNDPLALAKAEHGYQRSQQAISIIVRHFCGSEPFVIDQALLDNMPKEVTMLQRQRPGMHQFQVVTREEYNALPPEVQADFPDAFPPEPSVEVQIKAEAASFENEAKEGATDGRE